MSTYGVGQGLEREVGMAANVFMRAMQLKQQDAHFQQAMDLDLIWSGSVDWLDWAPAMRMREGFGTGPGWSASLPIHGAAGSSGTVGGPWWKGDCATANGASSFRPAGDQGSIGCRALECSL